MYNLIDDSAEIDECTIVEYGAVISNNVVIGKDCYIGYHAIIRPHVIIGDGSEVRTHCFIAEGAKIGNNVNIYQFSSVCQRCVIEDKVFIGLNTIMINTKKISVFRDYKGITEAPYIEYGARLGSGVLIMPGVRIGTNSMIQAGSLVTKSTDPYGIYRGQPAVKIGEVSEDERI